jgi:hypothetical protein
LSRQIGATGFEPAASWTQKSTARASQDVVNTQVTIGGTGCKRYPAKVWIFEEKWKFPSPKTEDSGMHFRRLRVQNGTLNRTSMTPT